MHSVQRAPICCLCVLVQQDFTEFGIHLSCLSISNMLYVVTGVWNQIRHWSMEYRLATGVWNQIGQIGHPAVGQRGGCNGHEYVRAGLLHPGKPGCKARQCVHPIHPLV
jgi:hypothetical protein